MYFWFCVKDDFESVNNVISSDSEDDMFIKYVFEVCYNSFNVVCDVLVLIFFEVVIRFICFDFLNKVLIFSISYY